MGVELELLFDCAPASEAVNAMTAKIAPKAQRATRPERLNMPSMSLIIGRQ
jgi:hypothetical protein